MIEAIDPLRGLCLKLCITSLIESALWIGEKEAEFAIPPLNPQQQTTQKSPLCLGLSLKVSHQNAFFYCSDPVTHKDNLSLNFR